MVEFSGLSLGREVTVKGNDSHQLSTERKAKRGVQCGNKH